MKDAAFYNLHAPRVCYIFLYTSFSCSSIYIDEFLSTITLQLWFSLFEIFSRFLKFHPVLLLLASVTNQFLKSNLIDPLPNSLPNRPIR